VKKFSRELTIAVVALIILIAISGSAASTYFLLVPKSITTLAGSTATQTTVSLVTALVPTTTTQTTVETVVETSSIYLSPEAAEYTNQTSGLELELATNVSVIFAKPQFSNESHAILVMVSLLNTLVSPNNLTAARNWPLPDLAPGLCSDYNQPFGIDIMKGYYTRANITSASPLQLFAQQYCPVYFPPAYFVFDPKSNYVNTVSQKNTSEYTNPLGDAEREIPLSGYCCTDVIGTKNCTCITYGAIPFQVGTYTVAGGDEWGDLVLLHFSVLP
jgi:hypothetical protein